MATFRYEKEGKNTIIPNATLYKGKVVSQEGNKLKPYFNKSLITDDIKEKLSTIKYINSSNENIALPYMLVMGENVGGGIIIDADAERTQKQKEEQEAIKKGDKVLKLGYNTYGLGLMLLDRIPADLFAKIKAHAEYFKANEEDMEFLDDQYGILCPKPYELRGWYYKFETITILAQNGIKMEYDGFEVNSIEEFHSAMDQSQKRYEEKEKTQKELQKLKSDFKKRINDLKTEYVTEEEAIEASKLPRIHVLDFKGADIYGGGSWLHVKDDEIGYIVRNNGMDGDDWRLNNYPTGGAGAICYRVKGLKQIIEEIKQANL